MNGQNKTDDSGIAGVVRDSSGAVLPGVTVEAASPALIEKVRSEQSRRGFITRDVAAKLINQAEWLARAKKYGVVS